MLTSILLGWTTYTSMNFRHRDVDFLELIQTLIGVVGMDLTTKKNSLNICERSILCE